MQISILRMPDYPLVELLLQTCGMVLMMSWNHKHRAIWGATSEEGTTNAKEQESEAID